MFTVLLVEDDPMVRQVNEQFVGQIEGLQIIGVAANGVEGLQQMKKLKPDVVLMDIFMPEQDGIHTLQKMRDAALPIDVITVTAANDQQTIEKILQLGVFDYIMKPFTFERMKQTMQKYMHYKDSLRQKTELTQQDLDAIIHPVTHETFDLPALENLPKGLNKSTLNKIMQSIANQKKAMTAEEVASGVGLARVTARRYLDYLEKQRILVIDIEYGTVGRPVNQYRLQ